MDYYDKYIKYKNKYLNSKEKLLNGGDKTKISNITIFNAFPDEEMDKYLNPIYGLIMCETGYLCNTHCLYHLYKNTVPDKNNTKIHALNQDRIIYDNVIQMVHNHIQPNSTILNTIKPIDIGKYIAIKYINKCHNILHISKDNTYYLTNDLPKNTNKELNELITYVKTLNPLLHISIHDKHEEIYYHILLFCLWWISKDDRGLSQYYEGINQIFNIINNSFINKIHYPNIVTNNNHNYFAEQVLNITKKSFHIYDQGPTNNICTTSKNNTYRDHGEVTARNFINLICFDGDNFDISILQSFNPKTQLVEYYNTYHDFSKQTDAHYKVKIYDQEINARDAWNTLITEYVNNNISFKNKCTGNRPFEYELKTGMSKDGKISNFYQLIKNLLGIDNWNDITTKSKYIHNILDNTEKGIGEIIVTHDTYPGCKILCKPAEYTIIMDEHEKHTISYDHLTDEQKKYVHILSKKEQHITIDNYIWIRYDIVLLLQLLKTRNDLFVQLFELSLTNKYNYAERRRIQINTNDVMFTHIVKLLNTNMDTRNKAVEYTYVSNDFMFLSNMGFITKLPIVILGNITNIDLRPLSNIVTIGNNFLSKKQLETINLSPLIHINSIGNNFLYKCTIREINLSALLNLTIINKGFLAYCNKLENIDLTPLSNVITIHSHFLYKCEELQFIDLTPLIKLEIVGDSFLSGCKKLKHITCTMKQKSIIENKLDNAYKKLIHIV